VVPKEEAVPASVFGEHREVAQTLYVSEAIKRWQKKTVLHETTLYQRSSHYC
jgi:hypothetical protein